MEQRYAEHSTFSETEEQDVAEEKARVKARDKVTHLMGQYLLKGYRMLASNCSECQNILLRKKDGTDFCVYCKEVAIQDLSTDSTATMESCEPAKSAKPTPSTSDHNPNTSPGHRQLSPKTSHSGSVDGDRDIPVVCAGKTGDTFKLTTTPADRDHSRVYSQSKLTGTRTYSGILQSMSSRTAAHTDNQTEKKSIAKRRAVSVDDLDPPPSAPAALGPQPKPIVLSSLQEACIECREVLVTKLKWCTQELTNSQSLENSILLCKLITSIGEALKSLSEEPLSLSDTNHHT